MSLRDTHREEERIFGEALAVSPAERAAYIVRACGADVTLLKRVSELLREHEQSTQALDRLPDLGLRDEPEEGALSLVGREDVASNSGRYVLGDKLGEGGWGVVYAAEQSHPVRRSVAIKIIKLGMDTRSIVLRFHGERQALALMDHENIARVYDAGETANGRPFFVMERVSGTRITQYCDEQGQSIEERLELFMQVCEAVQHAHQKGVIHRDLKPSNILVSQVNGVARPKIIDFGIAKATQGRLTEETVVTEVESFVGTPAYMSPEQADRRDDVIDTRSDIYSLGVVLYELLTGCTPLKATDVSTLGVEEVRRQIREVEATRPSARVGQLEPAVQRKTAERRGMTGAKLVDSIAGDLDRVVLKCLEKQPAGRYESASALAQDLRRHLNHEPISAIPPGQWYVWGKFVRRNRMAFGIAAAIGLTLVTAVMVSTLLLFREKAAVARAVAAEHEQTRAREEAEKSSQQAKTEATRSARATEFMTSVFNGVKPAVARGRDTELLRELLDEAAVRLDVALGDEPKVEAELSNVIGEAFWHIDEPGRAARMHRQALTLHEQTLGQNDPKVAYTLLRLGLFEMYHGSEVEAEKHLRRAADIRGRVLGPEDPRTLDAFFFLVETLTRQRRFPEATELLKQVHAVQMRLFPANDLRLLRTEFQLGHLLLLDGYFTAAERTLREVVAKYPADTMGQSLSFFRAQPLQALSGLLLDQERIDEAIEILRETLASFVSQGSHNPVGLQLSYALHMRGRCDEALALAKGEAENARQLVNRDKSRRFIEWLAWATVRQGECLAHTGRGAEAEPLLHEACAVSIPPRPAISRHPAFTLAELLRERGRAVEADAVVERALRNANREGNQFSIQLLPAVYRSLRASQPADRLKSFMREQLASEAAWLEQKGAFAAAPYSLAILCAAAGLGEFALIAPVVRARQAWWEQHRPTEAPAYAYAILAAEILLAEGRKDEAEQALLYATEGFARAMNYWSSEAIWRAGHLDGALTRFYAASTKPKAPGDWRRFIEGGTFDPEWELELARVLLELGRHREAAEIIPRAKSRVEERLARKPGNDRLAAVVGRATALWKDCSARMERTSAPEVLSREEK